MPTAAMGLSSGACARCRGTSVLFAPQGERSLAQACECVARCPDCGGSGRRIRGENGTLFAEVCSCRAMARRVGLYNQARIPRHFCGKGFESFQHYEEPGLKAALVRVQSFAEGYPKFGKGVLLHGPTGTGKTHLLCGALQHLTLQRGVRARYVEFSFLISEIKEAFMRNVSALVALAPLAEVDVLAIDELGKGRCTDFERETLDELIGRRYNADRTTLFASNYSAAPRRDGAGAGGLGGGTTSGGSVPYVSSGQLVREALGDQHLRERVGDRTFSRLAEMAEVIPIQARDRRQPPG